MRHGVDQPFNYYDTFSRAWEPLAGGLLAIWMPRTRVPNWLRNAVGVIALGLILTCGWWLDGVAEYPGPWALVPVGSTIALIWVGATAPGPIRSPDGQTQPQPEVSRMLATPQGIWLGNIAYPLYLIHWPLLIFYLTWRDKNHANFVEGTALLVLSVLLAWLCKRYIEDPVRYSRRRSRCAARQPGDSTQCGPQPQLGTPPCPDLQHRRDGAAARRRHRGRGRRKVWAWHVMSQRVDTAPSTRTSTLVGEHSWTDGLYPTDRRARRPTSRSSISRDQHRRLHVELPR